jgi:CBS domain-containing protein
MATIAELMTPEPITVRPDDTVQRAAQLMDELNVGALPVCDEEDHLVGIVTDRDITVRAIAAGLHPAITSVDLVMSDRVRSCAPWHSPDDVLQQMATVQIRRLPVLDGDDRLVGIVALGDLAVRVPSAAVEDALRRISTPAQPDRELVPA